MTLENLKQLLSAELFASIIETNDLITGSFQITNLKIISDIGVGENFVSKILKVNATVVLVGDDDDDVQHISLVVKHISSSMLDDEMIDEMNVFEKEIEMYQTVVPMMEKIWRDRAGIDIVFGPKLYYVSKEPEKFLVFENLAVDNYKMMNRLDGLNECQILLVLKKLAQWHAASRIYYDEYKPSQTFDTGMFKPSIFGFIEEHYSLFYKNFCDHLKKVEIDPVFIETIKTWEGKICSTNANIQIAHPNEFSVLNHADLWINNLMFNNDNVKLIDYQLSVYASPAVDLFYFLIMSVNPKLLTCQFDSFIAHYHKHLTESLRALNSNKMPTLKQLWADIMRKSFYGCVVAMEGLPSILIDHKNDNIDCSKAELANEDGYETRRQMFVCARVANALKVIIPYFGKRGMLEI